MMSEIGEVNLQYFSCKSNQPSGSFHFFILIVKKHILSYKISLSFQQEYLLIQYTNQFTENHISLILKLATNRVLNRHIAQYSTRTKEEYS